jgi:hypothetical protein
MPIVLSLAVTACGGGGGSSGGSASATIASFTKFTAVTAGTPTRIQGSSQEATYAWNSSTDKITSVGTGTAFGPTATADFTFNSSGNPTAISFTSAGGTTGSFSSTADTIGVLVVDAGTGAAVSAAGDKLLLFARSSTLGWDYQTFGVWATGINAGTGTAGAFSVGALTPGASIPTTGTGTYTGSAGGRYVDAAGNYYFTVASMTAATDFGARTINFSTTGTQQSVTLASGSFSNNNNLNVSGTLSYAAGTNQFSGNVSSVGGGVANAAMTGTATGNFYGPAAQEIGGGFAVRGTGTAGFMGAFGGKK